MQGRKGKTQKHTAKEIAAKHNAAKYANGAAGGGGDAGDVLKDIVGFFRESGGSSGNGADGASRGMYFELVLLSVLPEEIVCKRTVVAKPRRKEVARCLRAPSSALLIAEELQRIAGSNQHQQTVFLALKSWTEFNAFPIIDDLLSLPLVGQV